MSNFLQGILGLKRTSLGVMIISMAIMTLGGKSYSSENLEYIGPDIKCDKAAEIKDQEELKSAMINCIKKYPNWGQYYLTLSLMYFNSGEYEEALKWARDGFQSQQIWNASKGIDKPEWLGMAVNLEMMAAYAMALNGNEKYWGEAGLYADKIGGLFGCDWLKSSNSYRPKDPTIWKYDRLACQEASNFLSDALIASGEIKRACTVQINAYLDMKERLERATTEEEKSTYFAGLFYEGAFNFDRRQMLSTYCGVKQKSSP